MVSPISGIHPSSVSRPPAPVYPYYPQTPVTVGAGGYTPSHSKPLFVLVLAAVAIGLPVAIYRKPLLRKLGAVFSKSVQLPNSPIFAAHGLQPYIATKRDIPEVASLAGRFVSEAPDYERDNIAKYLASRTDEQLKQYLKMLAKRSPQLRNVDVDSFFPEFSKIIRDQKRLKELFASGTLSPEPKDLKVIEHLLKSRFIDNPNGALIVLKDKQGNIVAMEGINQFQKTHDMQIDLGIFDAIDPKHGLVTMLYVKPEYRGKGIGTTLKKQIIQHGREHLGYRYVWAPTAKQNSSHRLNQKLGYQPLTMKTTFPDSPVFTPELNKALRQEYNTGSRRLAWVDSGKVAT